MPFISVVTEVTDDAGVSLTPAGSNVKLGVGAGMSATVEDLGSTQLVTLSATADAVPVASTTVLGKGKVSVSPVDSASPVFVGDNDTRMAPASAGNTIGDIQTWNGSAWVRVAAGTAGKVFTANGTGVAPTYQTPAAIGPNLFLAPFTSPGAVNGSATTPPGWSPWLLNSGVIASVLGHSDGSFYFSTTSVAGSAATYAGYGQSTPTSTANKRVIGCIQVPADLPELGAGSGVNPKGALVLALGSSAGGTPYHCYVGLCKDTSGVLYVVSGSVAANAGDWKLASSIPGAPMGGMLWCRLDKTGLAGSTECFVSTTGTAPWYSLGSYAQSATSDYAGILGNDHSATPGGFLRSFVMSNY